MMARIWIALGAVLALIALVLEAFAYHRLQGELAVGPRYLFEIANDAHMTHALALIGVGALSGLYGSRVLLNLAGIAFTLGIVLFAGGVYSAMGGDGGGARAGTPLGGLLLMAGWAFLALSVLTFKKPQ